MWLRQATSALLVVVLSTAPTGRTLLATEFPIKLELNVVIPEVSRNWPWDPDTAAVQLAPAVYASMHDLLTDNFTYWSFTEHAARPRPAAYIELRVNSPYRNVMELGLIAYRQPGMPREEHWTPLIGPGEGTIQYLPLQALERRIVGMLRTELNKSNVVHKFHDWLREYVPLGSGGSWLAVHGEGDYEEDGVLVVLELTDPKFLDLCYSDFRINARSAHDREFRLYVSGVGDPAPYFRELPTDMQSGLVAMPRDRERAGERRRISPDETGDIQITELGHIFLEEPNWRHGSCRTFLDAAISEMDLP